MNDLIELGSSVEADIAKENLKELIVERADDVLELITGAAPGLSVITKLKKIYRSVNDYFLMEKIVTFLTDLSSMKTSERKNLINKLNNDPIHGQEFGKFLIVAIDRLEFVDKAVYLARACKFYEREDISQPLLTKIKGIIEKIDLADLKKLGYREDGGCFGYPNGYKSQNLYLFQSLDLVNIEHSIGEFENYNQMKALDRAKDLSRPSLPKLTDLGKILIYVINDIPFDKWMKQKAIQYSL